LKKNVAKDFFKIPSSQENEMKNYSASIETEKKIVIFSKTF